MKKLETSEILAFMSTLSKKKSAHPLSTSINASATSASASASASSSSSASSQYQPRAPSDHDTKDDDSSQTHSDSDPANHVSPRPIKKRRRAPAMSSRKPKPVFDATTYMQMNATAAANSSSTAAKLMSVLDAASRNADNIKSCPDVLRAPVMDYANIEKIRENFRNMFQPHVPFPDNAVLASSMLTNDILPRLGTVDPAAIMSANPLIFQTVHMMLEAYASNRIQGSSTTMNGPRPSTAGGNATGGDMSAEEATAEMLNLRNIEIVPRAWEESYLCSAVDQERDCVAGPDCVAKATFGFIMKEFLTPREHMTVATSRTLNQHHKPCLVCIRDSCIFAHAIMACDQSSATPNITAQPHRVLTGIPGEYSANDCIPTNASILYHMPLNKRGGYSQPKLENGVFRVTQSGYAKIEPIAATRPGF